MLAQFGGVTLAFAFVATIGPTSGFLFHAPWFYDFPLGIGLIYIYFQIPLMVLVFLPAVEGIKTAMAGGDRDPRRLGVGLLAPCRRAAAAPAVPGRSAAAVRERALRLRHDPAWENQIPYVVPQQISTVAVQRGRARLDERGPGAGPRAWS